MTEPVLECRNLVRSYQDAGLAVDVLADVNLSVAPGEKLAITGASGSGKSTLLNLLGGLDMPTAGEVRLAGHDWQTLSEGQRCRLRNRHLGFVYQFHHLLPEFDARENVAMPLLIAGRRRAVALQDAGAMLERVGLASRYHHRPGQLSGGERQRVAIARALVAAPDVVLMDEPTGNLDPGAASQVLALIEELRSEQSSFIVVTHDPVVASHMERRYELCNGRLEAR